MEQNQTQSTPQPQPQRQQTATKHWPAGSEFRANRARHKYRI